ncbi:hypothetical protein [Porphyromonas circumdentaria]|uniref:Uncharacterized protein n=1 Tax=Porphyromonas circumdentaria TaxID=29524 RepID=A0A1T4PIR7_9PORP|nr:hypothetical protein [Porphyromonas circumdentaria]MBB6276393.1 hypothetical protein [Porphyromonas circumdentaria]SJZ91434.1 hypothetical protein SAMN02745171_01474 [Porphyromonas circumdentaria]
MKKISILALCVFGLLLLLSCKQKFNKDSGPQDIALRLINGTPEVLNLSEAYFYFERESDHQLFFVNVNPSSSPSPKSDNEVHLLWGNAPISRPYEAIEDKIVAQQPWMRDLEMEGILHIASKDKKEIAQIKMRIKLEIHNLTSPIKEVVALKGIASLREIEEGAFHCYNPKTLKIDFIKNE